MFKEKLDINFPDAVFDLSTLTNANQLYTKMRKIKATHYAYAFYWRPNILGAAELLQIGESAPKDETIKKHTLGERIARKSANLLGWKTKVVSSHGIDLQRNLELAFENGNLPRIPVRTEMLVAVWNLNTKTLCALSATKREQSRWAEGELTRQYKLNNQGRAPVCNIVDCQNNKAFRKGYVEKESWTHLFVSDDTDPYEINLLNSL